MLFLRFKRKCIYIIALLGSNMDKETIERIEKMIKNAVQDMFDKNYCPHGSECRFCREDSSRVRGINYDMEWYSASKE